MMNNSFGECFRITTFGESHGAGIGVIVDGVPAGIALEAAEIQLELDRRRPGQSAVATQRQEADQVEILSGIFEGKTTGTSLAMLIRNTDQRSRDYGELAEIFRPGHADYGYFQKYGIRDYRGGGRSSGRETAARVAAGAIAKKMLTESGIRIVAHTIQIGSVKAQNFDPGKIEENPVRCADEYAAVAMVEEIRAAQAAGDSVGGVVECRITGVPAGWGEPVFDKLDAVLAHGIFSLGGVKALEFGDGIAAAGRRGSENNDPMTPEGFVTNHAGGVLGGISSGAEIVFRTFIKGTPSISQEQQTVDRGGNARSVQVHGRHDPCLCGRMVPVIEAMTALVLTDMMIRQDRNDKKGEGR
ncbi:MAG: chorismate synthase [Lentisphaeria bacterium]|nr:chorismate synthase [Lentisphaeria bacterium]